MLDIFYEIEIIDIALMGFAGFILLSGVISVMRGIKKCLIFIKEERK